jgi:hypothetical protein
MPLATWVGGGDCQLPPPQSFRRGSTAVPPPTPGRAGPAPLLLSPSPTPWEKGVTPPAGPPLRRGLAGARPGRRGAASSPAPAGGAATVAPPHNPTRKFPVTVPVGRACAAPPGLLPPPGQPPPEGRTRRRSGGGRRGREGEGGRGRGRGREREGEGGREGGRGARWSALPACTVVSAPRIIEGHQYAKVGVIWPRNPIQRLLVLRVSPGATSQMDTTALSSLAPVLRGLSNIF